MGARFLMDGQTVLVHGHSRVVIAILQHAAARGCHFNVLVTEGRPVDSGIKTAKALSASGIPVTLIMDSGCAFHMARCAARPRTVLRAQGLGTKSAAGLWRLR